MAESIAEQIQREWREFREVNDRRLAEVEKHGQATTETQAQVDRANQAITDLQTELSNKITNQDKRVEELEERWHRTMLMGSPGEPVRDEQRVAYASWQSMVQGKPVDPAHVDMELVRNYQTAFRDYMRHGNQADADNLRFLNSMSVGSDADGGYWVDPDTSGRIAQLVYETSPVRQVANVQTVSTDALEGTVDLGEAGSGWVGETESRSETDTPTIGRWRIEVHEQYAEPRSTQKLLDDAMVNVEEWLSGKVVSRFTRQENAAFVDGNGVHRPRGFLTYTAGTPSATTWDVIEQVNSGASAALDADGLIDLVFSLKSVYRQGAVFGMNRLTEAAVRKLTDGQDNYLWQPDFQERASARLLGHPIIEMPDMPDVDSNALPVVFGNFTEAYQIVDRMGVRVLRDPYTTKGWVKFYSTKRVGGGVVNFEAIKIQKISNS